MLGPTSYGTITSKVPRVPVEADNIDGLSATKGTLLYVKRGAGFTYTFVFLLFFVMITTGLALYNVNAPVGSPFRAFHFLLPLWGGAQTARFVHHVAMWLILGFADHHIYSAILMSQVEARGTVESMASGYKFVPCEDLVYSGYRFFDRRDA